MPPKKKKKKDKKPKEIEETAVDRTFLELTVTDLNNKLARLRAHNAKIEDLNEELTSKMHQFEEDRGDVTAFLDRHLAEKTEIIKEMDERLEDLARVREEEAKEAANKIKELEQKNKVTHDQLSSEIKLLNGKLSSLEEFRVQKDELMAKFDDQEILLRDKERSHNKLIYEMERKVLLEKDQLKKDVEKRLLRLSDEFTKSNEIRMAGYTKRLIRENISLDNEMDKMIASQKKIEEENNKIRARARELEELFSTNEAIKHRLIKTCQNQVGVIEKLTDNYEALKTKHAQYVIYKSQFENSLKRDICDKFTLGDMHKKLTVLSQRVELVKAEKAELIATNLKLQAEIDHLKDIIKNIKFTVRSAIRSTKDCTDDRVFRKAQRNTLLQQLMEILTTDTDFVEIPSISSLSSGIYYPGDAGIMRRSESLMEILKREARKIAAAPELETEEDKPYVGKIIPKPRTLDFKTLFDVETVSSLTISSVHEQDEEVVEEEEMEEDANYASSSGSDVAAKAHKTDEKKCETASNSLCDEFASKHSDHDGEEISTEGLGEEEDDFDEEEEYF